MLPKNRGLRSVIELFAIVAAALFFAMAIQAYAVKPYVIPSGSMLPTLAVGQRLLVNRVSHRLGADPQIGDITVFLPPKGAEIDGGNQCGAPSQGPSTPGGRARHSSCATPQPGHGSKAFIKRVVGLPGDRIAVRDGHVVRNGRQADEPFIAACGGGPECTLDEITIPAGEYFLMGDNRGDSDDSRYWGPVPRSQIIGEAIVTYWPPNRIGGT